MKRSAPAIAIALLVLGCGPGAEEPPPPASTSGAVVVVEVQTNAPATPLPAHTLWVGRYECAQGVTGLALTLDVDASGAATAVFDFGAVPENPTVPSGRYLMRGSVDAAADGAAFVTLAPDRWIARPDGYVMVGLRGTIDAAGRTLLGNVEHPSCTRLALQRQQ